MRCDFPGFGRTPLSGLTVGFATEVADLLDELGMAGAGIVGCSLGGGAALELAVGRPELVRALVLVGAGLPGGTPSDAMNAYDAAETEAVARGDLDAATEVNLRMWVDGPRRTPGDVEPAVRAAVGEMQRNALEQYAPHWDDISADHLVESLADRIGEIQVPTLIIVGEEDVEDMHHAADVLEERIAGSRRASVPGTAHVPNFERPEAFDALVLDFFAEVL